MKPVFTGKNQVIASASCLWETRIDPDLSPDGQRLLMLKESAGADAPSNQSQVILIQNWFDELQRLVPTP